MLAPAINGWAIVGAVPSAVRRDNLPKRVGCVAGLILPNFPNTTSMRQRTAAGLFPGRNGHWKDWLYK